MPDWITHIAVAYTVCTIIGFKFKQFNNSNTVIAMIGALVPDIFKIGIIIEFLGSSIYDYLTPLHLPVGSLIMGGIISLFFQEKKTVFLFLVIGIITHYALDLLLISLGNGITLFFPFYWGQYQLELVPNDDYKISILAVAVAVVVYLISYKLNRAEGYYDEP